MERLSVIVCDDHQMIRVGLCVTLATEEIISVGECGNIEDLLRIAKNHPNAVVVTDLGVDNTQFPELMQKLRAESPSVKVVVYSMREQPSVADLCYRAGARAFVPKSADIDELVKAIRAAHLGKLYVPSIVGSEMMASACDPRSPMQILSRKDLEIFVDFASGLSADEIAQKVGLSNQTIHNRLTKISKALGVSRGGLRFVARDFHIIQEKSVI